VVPKCDRLRALKFSSTLPRAFTKHAAIQAADVLNRDATVGILAGPSSGHWGRFDFGAFFDTRELDSLVLAFVEACLSYPICPSESAFGSRSKSNNSDSVNPQPLASLSRVSSPGLGFRPASAC